MSGLFPMCLNGKLGQLRFKHVLNAYTHIHICTYIGGEPQAQVFWPANPLVRSCVHIGHPQLIRFSSKPLPKSSMLGGEASHPVQTAFEAFSWWKVAGFQYVTHKFVTF